MSENYSYGYSEAFNQLKQTVEKLDSNYSTRDYVGALDLLLFNAVKSVVFTSTFSDTFIASTCAWYSSNAKRRISRLQKAEFFGLVGQMLATNDPQVKFEKIQKMQLERTILFFMVDLWLQSLNGYNQCISVFAQTRDKDKRTRIEQYELKIGKRKNPAISVYSAIREAKFWLTNYLSLKEMILEKYSRLIITTAQKDYKAMGHRVNLSDLVQNYMITASRALDKCDFKQGTLTSYLQLWMKSARCKSIRVDSIDSGPSGDSSIICERLDDADRSDNTELSSEDTSHSDDQVHNVRALVKLVDPLGIFRLMTGISEVLSKGEMTLRR